MATRREILKENKKLKADVSKAKKDSLDKEPENKYNTKTSGGFIRGAIVGGGIGFALGVAFGNKLFLSIAGVLAGGYIAENLKNIRNTSTGLKESFNNIELK